MFDSSKIKTKEQLLEEEQSQIELKAIQDFKSSRQELLDEATVTTSEGNVYDADEVSIIRLSYAISAAIDNGSTDSDLLEWSLANTGTGVMTDVTLSDLKEARKLAVQNMSTIWSVS